MKPAKSKPSEAPAIEPPDDRPGHYPRLLWSSDGVEVTVETAADYAEKIAAGYREQP